MRQQPANADAQADLLGCGAARWWAQLLPARGAWGAVEGARSGCLMRAAPLLVRPRLLSELARSEKGQANPRMACLPAPVLPFPEPSTWRCGSK